MASIPMSSLLSSPDGGALATCGGSLLTSRALPRAQTYWYHPHLSCGGDHSADGGNTRAGSDGVMRTGLQANKICSLPRFGSSVLRRRIFSIGMPVLFSSHQRCLYCAGLAPSGPSLCSVTDATATEDTPKASEAAEIVYRAEPSFSLLLSAITDPPTLQSSPVHFALNPGGNCT